MSKLTKSQKRTKLHPSGNALLTQGEVKVRAPRPYNRADSQLTVSIGGYTLHLGKNEALALSVEILNNL